MKTSVFPGTVVQAYYAEAENPEHRGNPLIEALPAPLSKEGACELLSNAPSFREEDRRLPGHERISRVFSLARLSVPLEIHCETALKLDAMIREGYVHRAPKSGEQNRIAQSLYEASVRGEAPCRPTKQVSPLLEAMALGVPGMGKTHTARHAIYRMPQVIYHPSMGTYQVTYLEAEMPSNGSSIGATLTDLIRQLDSLIPASNYYYEYAVRGRPSDVRLLSNLAYLANLHSVGVVALDEVQNLNNSVKSGQVTMAHLVATLNTLRVPVIGLGTNAAYKIIGGDARVARRAATVALSHWDRLPEHVKEGVANEWREFMQILWQYQWIMKARPLDEWILRLFYERCQGILALAVALFVACQVQAIYSGGEELTPELIESVYQDKFKPVHEFVPSTTIRTRH
jgi:hypothetical protein